MRLSSLPHTGLTSKLQPPQKASTSALFPALHFSSCIHRRKPTREPSYPSQKRPLLSHTRLVLSPLPSIARPAIQSEFRLATASRPTCIPTNPSDPQTSLHPSHHRTTSSSIIQLDGTMEPTPLVKAHDHARAAAVATRQASDTTVAVNEHTHAAGEFANAARSTSSVEALRTLKLLEEHHRRLAELLNLDPSPPTSQDAIVDSGDEKAGNGGGGSEKTDDEKAAGRKDDAGAAAADGAQPGSGKAMTQKPGLPGQKRIASREMSSSIASNLASARGIRTKTRGRPLSPSISNDQGLGNVEPHPRRGGSRSKMKEIIDQQQQPATGKPAWVPPMPSSPPKRNEAHLKSQDSTISNASSAASPTTTAPADDSGYSRFYNTFGSLINKISTPLALAGLPLIQEESTASQTTASPEIPSPKPSPKQPKSRPPLATVVEPDLSKIYSKATMRAISGDSHSAADSFYVVPTSGHTVSYARILSYSEKEKQRQETPLAGNDDEDDFVDARDGPSASTSSGAKQRIGRGRTDKELTNTVEELYTENQTLKVSLDKLTKRLHAFEASAQNMAESYRLMRPGSPLATTSSAASASGSKSRESEEEFAALRKQVERLERDNKKMQRTLEKYREKWETLKAGAKARRAQGGGESVEEAVPA